MFKQVIKFSDFSLLTFLLSFTLLPTEPSLAQEPANSSIYSQFTPGAGFIREMAIKSPAIDEQLYLGDLKRHNISLTGLSSMKGGMKSGTLSSATGNSDRMTGTVAVAVFFIEKDPRTDPAVVPWTKAREDSLLKAASEALQFWVNHATGYGISLKFQIFPYHHDSLQAVSAPGDQNGDSYCISQVMKHYGYTSGFPNDVNAFNAGLRVKNQTDRAFSVFIFNYSSPPSGYYAYAYYGGPVILNEFPGFTFKNTLNHETAHAFWAYDEYYYPGYGGNPDTTGLTGSPRPDISNGNNRGSVNSKINTADCIMNDMQSPYVCAYTAAQLGWINSVEMTEIRTIPSSLAMDVMPTSMSRYKSPQSFPFGRGTTVKINVPAPQQPAKGMQYSFAGWSDGGSREHTITVTGSQATPVTAGFSSSSVSDNPMWLWVQPTNAREANIRHIAVDRDNSVWVTTGKNSVLHFKDSVREVFDYKNSPLPAPGEWIPRNPVAIDKEGTKWFGVNGSILSFDGTAWRSYTPGGAGPGGLYYSCIAVDKNNNKWFGSTDNGVSMFDGHKWTIYNKSNSPVPDNWICAATVDSGNNIWIGTSKALLRFDGRNWTVFDGTNSPVGEFSDYALVAGNSGEIMYGGSGHGLAVYKNGSWEVIQGTPWGYVIAAATNYEGKLYAANGALATYQSNNGWTLFSGYNDMIYQISVNDIKIDHSGSKWIGTENGLWVYNEKWQNVLKIKEPSYDNGMAFRLEQNSPNPFTGSTLIRYRLPVYCRVTLKVYNALGREVRTLVDEQQHTGTYSVVFNAGNLPEGVYYCRLQSGEYYDTRKFLLLK